MKTDFEVGQLVRSKFSGDLGSVLKVDRDYYGARQAFKVYGATRGQALKPDMVNGIGPTKHGIRDRVLVLWYTCYENDGSSNLMSCDGMNLYLMEGEDLEVSKKELKGGV
jgi:hypothetical protein